MTTAATPVQKAALHRLQSLAESDNNLDKLLEGRAASKVVRMLMQSSADSGACLQPSPERIISVLCPKKSRCCSSGRAASCNLLFALYHAGTVP